MGSPDGRREACGVHARLPMLPPYIIEELRRREEARREESARRQPVVELPLAPPPRREPKRDEPERGVTIIDVL